MSHSSSELMTPVQTAADPDSLIEFASFPGDVGLVDDDGSVDKTAKAASGAQSDRPVLNASFEAAPEFSGKNGWIAQAPPVWPSSGTPLPPAHTGEYLDEPILLDLAPEDASSPGVDPALLRASIAGSVLSVMVHVWLLIALAGVAMEYRRAPDEPPIETRFYEKVETEIEEEEIVPYELANPDDRELPIQKVLNARSIGQVQSEKPPQESRPTFSVEIDPSEFSGPVFDIAEGAEVDKQLVVKGTTGENLIQLESALDRVTWEISQNLKERKVLVVWLLDASGSLAPQRAAIEKRLKRIYGELGALQDLDQIPRLEQPLLSGVVAYGNSTMFLTKEPSEKFDAVRDAFRSLQTDETGVENVFTAVNQVLKQWSKYRSSNGRRIMLITVTDETGDDFGPPLEMAIANCRRFGAKAYVIGPSAVFGRRKGYLPYVAPENGQTYQLPVDLGPETAMMEAVHLPFWFNGPQYRYLSSGFGPYGLSRLVSETSGVFFLTNMTTTSELTPLGVFDSASIKPFAPDYRFGSFQEYEADLYKHPIRLAVVQAAQLAEESQPKGTPSLDIRVNPQNFRQVATQNQQSAAESQLALDTILQAFPPNIEKELEKERSPRWRMAFCLSYGRLLAQKTRCVEYNSALAQMKSALTPDDVAKKSNHWIIRPDREINYAPSMKRPARVAEELLRKVLEEAPGTPWAILASRELQDPFGLKVIEQFIPPPPPAPPGPPQPTKKTPALARDPQKPQPPAKPTPPPAPPKLPKV